MEIVEKQMKIVNIITRDLSKISVVNYVAVFPTIDLQLLSNAIRTNMTQFDENLLN